MTVGKTNWINLISHLHLFRRSVPNPRIANAKGIYYQITVPVPRFHVVLNGSRRHCFHVSSSRLFAQTENVILQLSEPEKKYFSRRTHGDLLLDDNVNIVLDGLLLVFEY